MGILVVLVKKERPNQRDAFNTNGMQQAVSVHKQFTLSRN